MRFFLTILILVPLVVSLAFTLDLVEALWIEGPKINLLFVFAIMASISGYLMVLLKKSFTPEWSQHDVQELKNISPQERKRLGTQSLFIVYLSLVILGIIFFDYELMKGTLGVFFFCLGLSMLWSSWALRRSRDRQTELRYLGMERSQYSKLKSVYFLLIISLGILAFLTYYWNPRFHFISPWDVAGVGFFLGSTYLWLAGFNYNEKSSDTSLPKIG